MMRKNRSACQQQKILRDAARTVATSHIYISHDVRLMLAHWAALTSRLTVGSLRVGYYYYYFFIFLPPSPSSPPPNFSLRDLSAPWERSHTANWVNPNLAVNGRSGPRRRCTFSVMGLLLIVMKMKTIVGSQLRSVSKPWNLLRITLIGRVCTR